MNSSFNEKVIEITMALLMIVGLYMAFNHAINCAASIDSDAITATDIIVIDCGHGGIDGGKIGINGAVEKEINLSIGYFLKELLENAGFNVVMTRYDDNGLYDEMAANKKAADMKKRCEIIKNSGCDLCISIHQNSYTSSTVHGAQMFYYKNSQEGKRLAECVENSVRDNLGADTARPSKYNDNYYMLLHSTCPTVIAECGFLSNREEADRLASEAYQQLMARALYLGIMDFYGR